MNTFDRVTGPSSSNFSSTQLGGLLSVPYSNKTLDPSKPKPISAAPFLEVVLWLDLRTQFDSGGYSQIFGRASKRSRGLACRCRLPGGCSDAFGQGQLHANRSETSPVGSVAVEAKGK